VNEDADEKDGDPQQEWKKEGDEYSLLNDIFSSVSRVRFILFTIAFFVFLCGGPPIPVEHI